MFKAADPAGGVSPGAIAAGLVEYPGGLGTSSTARSPFPGGTRKSNRVASHVCERSAQYFTVSCGGGTARPASFVPPSPVDVFADHESVAGHVGLSRALPHRYPDDPVQEVGRNGPRSAWG